MVFFILNWVAWKEITMSDHPTISPRFPVFRRLWKPAIVTGAGGTTLAILFDEFLMFGEEILALIFLPITAGLIYMFNIFVFNSRMPRREDLENSDGRGAKK
jgi:hypothetical protein